MLSSVGLWLNSSKSEPTLAAQCSNHPRFHMADFRLTVCMCSCCTGNQEVQEIRWATLGCFFVVSTVCLFLLCGGTPGFLYHLASCTDDLQVAHLISCTTLFPVEMPSGGHLNRKSGGTGNQLGHLEVISTGNQLEQEIRWATWGSSVQKPWMTGSFGEAVCIRLQLLYIFSNSTGGQTGLACCGPKGWNGYSRLGWAAFLCCVPPG